MKGNTHTISYFKHEDSSDYSVFFPRSLRVYPCIEIDIYMCTHIHVYTDRYTHMCNHTPFFSLIFQCNKKRA